MLLCYIGSKLTDIYTTLKSKCITSKLATVTSNVVGELFNCYLHDFIMYFCGLLEYSEDIKVY